MNVHKMLKFQYNYCGYLLSQEQKSLINKSIDEFKNLIPCYFSKYYKNWSTPILFELGTYLMTKPN